MSWWYPAAARAKRIGIGLPEEIGALYADLFGRSLVRVERSLATSTQPARVPRLPSIPRRGWPSREVSPVWRRSPGGRIQRLPLYGGERSGQRNVLVSVPVGADLFRGKIEWDGSPDVLPEISIGAPRAVGLYRSLGIPLPVAELSLARMPASRRDEASRRRNDLKFGEQFGAAQYRNALALVNRTYGTMDEYREVLTAYRLNPDDPVAFLMANAMNQAVDWFFGQRASLLKKHVYSSRVYPLPVGIDMVSRLWQG